MYKNRSKFMGEMKTIMKGILFIIIFFVVIYSIVIAMNYKKINESIKSGIDLIKTETEGNDDEYKRKVYSKEKIYEEIHKMANTLIVPVDGEIWGIKKITKDNINNLLYQISNSDFDDKNVLIDILTRWKEYDYSQGVFDHNYVWEKLNGTVGKAIDLRKEYKKN